MIKRNKSLKEIEIVFNFNPNVGDDESPEMKTGVIKMNEPGWDEIAEAYKYITDDDGKMDLVTPGKLLFDLCCFEASPEMVSNHQVMLSVYSQISAKFVFPITAEVKKN
jgi:hypothetical protein